MWTTNLFVGLVGFAREVGGGAREGEEERRDVVPVGHLVLGVVVVLQEEQQQLEHLTPEKTCGQTHRSRGVRPHKLRTSSWVSVYLSNVVW